ncbi:MAG: hypothetical protein GX434_01310 [Peptococcaceae bacterium]|nr:hypothetical protein [Peptococcaceae bacterium]
MYKPLSADCALLGANSRAAHSMLRLRWFIHCIASLWLKIAEFLMNRILGSTAGFLPVEEYVLCTS